MKIQPPHVHKVGVVGSRNFSSYPILRRALIPLLPFVLVSGGAHGADRIAELFAKEHNLHKIIHKPDWNKYGKAAGFIRNTKIVNDSDTLVAFWDGKSKGTQDSINKARQNGIPIITVKF